MAFELPKDRADKKSEFSSHRGLVDEHAVERAVAGERTRLKFLQPDRALRRDTKFRASRNLSSPGTEFPFTVPLPGPHI